MASDIKNNFVYHGSHEQFEVAIPKRQKRGNQQDGKQVIIFDDISFHATPHRWIALAYTYHPKKVFTLEGRHVVYNMAVSLYQNNKKIHIIGIGSMEESMEQLYGDGGYLHVFDAKDFFHTQGLGDLEIISKSEVRPLRIERVDNPLAEFKSLGIEFKWHDVSLPENAHLRNYVNTGYTAGT